MGTTIPLAYPLTVATYAIAAGTIGVVCSVLRQSPSGRFLRPLASSLCFATAIVHLVSLFWRNRVRCMPHLMGLVADTIALIAAIYAPDYIDLRGRLGLITLFQYVLMAQVLVQAIFLYLVGLRPKEKTECLVPKSKIPLMVACGIALLAAVTGFWAQTASAGSVSLLPERLNMDDLQMEKRRLMTAAGLMALCFGSILYALFRAMLPVAHAVNLIMVLLANILTVYCPNAINVAIRAQEDGRWLPVQEFKILVVILMSVLAFVLYRSGDYRIREAANSDQQLL